ncbi:MAG TPA: hypothetical protein VGP26_00680 [Actinophytocola sp.]|nr:hypothetical protein [Actinophytocola sp.]
MSYGPQPGYPPPQYGPPHGYPGYGPPQRYGPPSTALAYVSALLFVLCGALALVATIVGWDGSAESPDLVIAIPGLAFSEDVTGNVDFAISAGMTVACSTLTFALLLFFRLDFVRWVLGVIGALVTVYYVYAIIKLLSDDLGSYVAMPIVSFVLWAAATVVVLLPATGRAMRGYQRKLAQHQRYPPRQPMGYPY